MTQKNVGEPVAQPLNAEQLSFLKKIALRNLNSAVNPDALKHLADVWWNLCQWEKQRADILDGKAQMLLGLSSIAGSFVAVAAPINATGLDTAAWLRVAAILVLLTAAVIAVLALRVTDYGGFLDNDVFGALTILENSSNNLLKIRDDDPYLAYLREISMQRWLVYISYKTASQKKARQVSIGQQVVIAGIALLVLSTLLTTPVASHMRILFSALIR